MVLVEGQLVVRPRPWRHLPLVLYLMATSAILIFAWVMDRRGQGIWFAAILGVGWAFIVGEVSRFKIIVASKEVRIISARRYPPVPRERITHIRALRWSTVFYNHERDELLRIGSDLSRKQLLALGDELGVTVWDHRAWLGIKKLKHGVDITVNRGGIRSRDGHL